MSKNTNLFQTILVTGLLSLGCIFIAFMVQYQANRSVSSCSYLDPVIIDVLATVFAIFLIIEGLVEIFRYRDYPLFKQLTRSIRVCLGFAILTIHIMQFIHK
jgi:hypothetical protein